MSSILHTILYIITLGLEAWLGKTSKTNASSIVELVSNFVKGKAL